MNIDRLSRHFHMMGYQNDSQWKKSNQNKNNNNNSLFHASFSVMLVKFNTIWDYLGARSIF